MAKSNSHLATAADVLEILNAHSVEVFQRLQLPIRLVQLSMPTDDKGPRIKVSLRPGSDLKVPSRFVFDLGGRKVQVPLETAEDYQNYSLR